MSFKDDFPEYAAIEHLIRRAHAERSVYIAHAIAGAVESVIRGLSQLASLGTSRAADMKAIEADSFLKRAVPKY